MSLQRMISYMLLGLVLGLTMAGCATVAVRTSGQGQNVRWQATDFRSYTVATPRREVYEYTLVLEEFRGRTITFTSMQAQFQNNSRSREFDWQKEGPWVLPARGKLRIPLGTYRLCRWEYCRDWGPLAPVWRLVLVGTDGQGQPVREVIQMRLPYVTETAA